MFRRPRLLIPVSGRSERVYVCCPGPDGSLQAPEVELADGEEQMDLCAGDQTQIDATSPGLASALREGSKKQTCGRSAATCVSADA